MLQHPKNAAPVLRTALPAAIVERCDWSTLKLSDRTYVDEKLRETHSDLLYEIQIGRHKAVIYVLLEHKSECDARTIVQLFVYVGQILKKYAEEDEGEEVRLPVVLPMILHHSKTGWTAATELAALYGEALEEEPGLKGHAPNLKCSLMDVSHVSDEELKAMALGAVTTLTLWALRDARSPARLLRAFGNDCGAGKSA
jgi:hypothetical protein